MRGTLCLQPVLSHTLTSSNTPGEAEDQIMTPATARPQRHHLALATSQSCCSDGLHCYLYLP